MSLNIFKQGKHFFKKIFDSYPALLSWLLNPKFKIHILRHHIYNLVDSENNMHVYEYVMCTQTDIETKEGKRKQQQHDKMLTLEKFGWRLYRFSDYSRNIFVLKFIKIKFKRKSRPHFIKFLTLLSFRKLKTEIYSFLWNLKNMRNPSSIKEACANPFR